MKSRRTEIASRSIDTHYTRLFHKLAHSFDQNFNNKLNFKYFSSNENSTIFNFICDPHFWNN